MSHANSSRNEVKKFEEIGVCDFQMTLYRTSLAGGLLMIEPDIIIPVFLSKPQSNLKTS